MISSTVDGPGAEVDAALCANNRADTSVLQRYCAVSAGEGKKFMLPFPRRTALTLFVAILYEGRGIILIKHMLISTR